ncbi:MAG: hypothetical protein V3U88_05070, partial [Methylococcales bacterium]
MARTSQVTTGIVFTARYRVKNVGCYCIQVTDLWHVTEYLADAAEAIFDEKKQQAQRIDWLKQRCHELKNKRGAVGSIVAELKDIAQKKHPPKRQEALHKTITYLSNQGIRMND